MPHVALLNADGVITGIKDVIDNEWVTDKAKGIVQLPKSHDMAAKVGQYYYDFDLNSFMPHVALKDDLDEVIDVLCEIVTGLCSKCEIPITQQQAEIITKWLSYERK